MQFTERYPFKRETMRSILDAVTIFAILIYYSQTRIIRTRAKLRSSLGSILVATKAGIKLGLL